MSTGIGFMGELTATFSEAIVPLGTIRRTDGDGKAYIFCKAATTCGAIAVGGAVFQLIGQDTGNVTDDVANSMTNMFVGLSMAVVGAASGLYFWAQCEGVGTALTVTNAAFTPGDTLYVAGTYIMSKAQATAGAAITKRVLAIALAAKATAGASVSVLLLK